MFIWNADYLTQNKTKLLGGQSDLQPALDLVVDEAKHALSREPYSVTHKTKLPPSGDKKDYYSIGPYWWPNPKKKSGLPYIRKDGETNPERNDESFDSLRFTHFARDVTHLTLAAYYTDNDEYAQHAATLIRHWFLNPETAMNPNLNYAQAIPGKVEGRGIGIIDTYRLVPLIDAIGLLAHKGKFTSTEYTALQDCFSQYSRWMLTSENGKDERKALNNHGVYFDAQLAIFAAFAGDQDAIKFVIDGVKKSRIPGQIDKNGKLPLELRRTRAFHYTAFTLNAFFDIAEMGECVGEDLWNFETFRGQSLRAALDYQANFTKNLETWPHKEIRQIYTAGHYKNLLRANLIYRDTNYQDYIDYLEPANKDNIARLIYPN